MAKRPTHARSSRVITTTGSPVGITTGRQVIQNAPQQVPNVVAGANAIKPAPVSQALNPSAPARNY